MHRQTPISDSTGKHISRKLCTCTFNDLLGAGIEYGLVPEKMQLFAVFAHVANSRHPVIRRQQLSFQINLPI
jgi:hypothetical protein